MSNSNAAFSALIHTAAMTLEINISDSGISFLTEESERYLKDFMNQVSVVYLTSRSPTISKQHFERVLKSRGEPPLLGYEPNIQQKELVFNGEYSEQEYNTVPLSKYFASQRKYNSRKVPFTIKYSLVDGVKVPSNPLTSKARSDRSRSDSADCVSGVLSKTQIDYIIYTLDYMRMDENHSFDLGLKEILEKEEKITIFIPYFLHIITAKMSIMLHDIENMAYLLHVSIALASNPHVDLMNYFHPFLRICMSALIASDVGSNGSDDDTPVRKLASELLYILHTKCHKAYPIMTKAIYNYLIGVLFNSNTSIAAHIGCIYGFIALGTSACEQLLPHLPGYLTVLKSISQCFSFEKTYQARSIIESIRELCEKVINESTIDESKYRAEEILDKLSTLFVHA